jgi:DNA-binding response OmpR family regulator
MDITSSEKNTLLIVDDDPTNTQILSTYLQKLNYEVLTAQDGEDALAKLLHRNQVKPDLILLDVMMPNLDGFETCRRLKENAETREIPIIFMTALTNTEDKLKGFEAGAVDYITKPLQYEEVSARVNVHLTLKNLQKVLQQQNAAIEQKNLELQRQTMELDAFAQFVARDLKKPLVRQSGFTNVLHKELAVLPNPEPLKFLQEIEHSRHQMTSVVDDMLLLVNARTNEVVMEAPDMVTIIAEIRHRLSAMIDKYQAKIVVPATWPIVWGYSPWVQKVWETYIINGLKYGGSPPHLELGATPEGNEHIRFWVRDNGLGFTAKQQSHMFVPLIAIDQTDTLQEGYGLKLSIVRLLIEKCGGQVGVETQVGRGSTFYFTLPALGENEF